MTQKSFETALKKGEIGESLVKRILEQNGWCVFQPTTQGAHCFDMLCIKDKKKAFALDVKSKQKLKYYNGTGIDERHYQVYKNFSLKYNMPFFLAFVDEGSGEVYGNFLSLLDADYFDGEKKYPLFIKDGAIRVWNMNSMKLIGNINKTESSLLYEYNQRNAKYD